MNRPTVIILAVGLLVASADSARAEEKLVTLKNGTKLQGRLENEAGPVVTVHTKKGPVRVPLNLIATITKVDAPKTDPKKPDPAKPETKPAPTPQPKVDPAKPDPTKPGKPADTTPVKPAPTPGREPIAAVGSPSEGAHPLEHRYAAVAGLPPTDRGKAILELAAAIPLEGAAEYLAATAPGPLSAPALVAVESFCEGGGPARDAALARLRAQNECGAGLFAALVRLWDKKAVVEDALIERLGQDCKDHVSNLAALAARGTRHSVAAIVDVLFFSPEKAGLTYQAQVALREIAKRDPSPDEALEPLLKNITPLWPGPEEPVRRRDVLLAMGGSSGKAYDYLAATLADLPPDHLDPRGNCWLSLARIGTKESLALLVKAFREGKLPDQAQEARRVHLLAEAVSEAAGGASRPDFLLAVADFHDLPMRPDLKREVLLAIERTTGQRFQGEIEKLRRLARQMIEKQLADENAKSEHRPEADR